MTTLIDSTRLPQSAALFYIYATVKHAERKSTYAITEMTHNYMLHMKKYELNPRR